MNLAKPYLIGIAGGSASGKTYLLNALLNHFNADEICLISQDHYYKPQAEQHIDENGQINYDLPDVAENYVHRVGRTGRGTQKGVAVSLCSPEEKPLLEEIEQFMDKKVNVLHVDRADYSETLALTEDVNGNWKQLLREAEHEDKKYKGKSKKKK